MEVLKKNNAVFTRIPVNPTALVFYLSCLVFILRLYACGLIFPGLGGMDYYGYIELARNIVQHLDFTVRWEFDSPFVYPPLFSILISLLTLLTKNFVTSILLINIFSASFYLVPLFALVRGMLGGYCASLALAFSIYFYGVKPCNMLNMDFFYSFLIIVLCWFIWDTLTHRSRQAGRYVLAGVLVGIADLTKFSGAFFGLAGIVSILHYFGRYQRDLPRGLKMSGLLILGALPLILGYHLLLDRNAADSVPNIGTRVFFDGNYMYQRGADFREGKITEINDQATEFPYVNFLKTHSIVGFSLQHPGFITAKYLWGLKNITADMSYTLLPVGDIPKSAFLRITPGADKIIYALMSNGYISPLKETSMGEVQLNPSVYLRREAVRHAAGPYFGQVWELLDHYRTSRKRLNLLIQGTFLLVLLLGAAYYQWRFDLVHILLFVSGLCLIPLGIAEERYLLPFMPLYFVLWLFGLTAGYAMIKKQLTDVRFLNGWVIVLGTCLVILYAITLGKQFHEYARFYKSESQMDTTWRTAASWIRQDSAGLSHRAKIMSLDNYIAYLTDAGFIRLPYFVFNWDRVLKFAAFKKVDYLVISGDFLDTFPGVSRGWPVKIFDDHIWPDNTILVYKI